ncbi:MAG: hypothetical protein SPJ99_05725 [Candidatus Coprenecus sp.]|nr:hypothetical protein [Candidatus Coprenecus sp.]
MPTSSENVNLESRTIRFSGKLDANGLWMCSSASRAVAFIVRNDAKVVTDGK